MKLRFAAAVFGLAALLVGCWSEGLVFPLGAPPRAPVTTDSMTYTARVVGDYFGNPIYQFQIIARYENTSTRPVIMLPCGDGVAPTWSISLVGDDNRDGSAFNPGWACPLSNTVLVVPPGGVRIDTFVVRGPRGFDGITHKPIGVIGGRLRLQYGAAWDCRPQGTCPLPDSLWETNEFIVRLGR